MPGKRTRIERANQIAHELESSDHHARELDSRLNVFISGPAVCATYEMTKQNLHSALDAGAISPCFTMDRIGPFFQIWSAEIVFGGGVNDDGFGARMQKIDALTQRDFPTCIYSENQLEFFRREGRKPPLQYFAHTRPMKTERNTE